MDTNDREERHLDDSDDQPESAAGNAGEYGPADRPPPPPPDWAEHADAEAPEDTTQPRQPPVQQPPPRRGYGGGDGDRQPPGGGSQHKTSRRPLTIIAILLVLMLVGLVGVWGLFYLVDSVTDTQSAGISVGGDRVGLITISGLIHAGGRGAAFFGETPGSRAIMEEIRQAKKDDSVKAVVLRINSPGGSAAASSAIYKEVAALAEEKPVIASFGDVAASGGYYVACAADEIVTNGATMTASIGVIMSGMGYYGLMDKLGLSNQTIKAGKYKDMGSPLRPMTPEEEELLQQMLDDVYQQFVDAILEGRKMPEDTLMKYADGRVMTGQQAKEAGLVDRMGNFHDAVKLAGEKGGIKGEPKLKTFGPPATFLDQLMGTESLFSTPKHNSIQTLQGPLLIEPGCYAQLLLEGMLSKSLIDD